MRQERRGEGKRKVEDAGGRKVRWETRKGKIQREGKQVRRMKKGIVNFADGGQSEEEDVRKRIEKKEERERPIRKK